VGVPRQAVDTAKVAARFPLAVATAGGAVAALETAAERAQRSGRPRLFRGSESQTSIVNSYFQYRSSTHDMNVFITFNLHLVNTC
jgi:hypothetical protein